MKEKSRNSETNIQVILKLIAMIRSRTNHVLLGPLNYASIQGGSSTVSNSHYHSATTASISSPSLTRAVRGARLSTVSPPYLELINHSENSREYEIPRHQHMSTTTSQCSCVNSQRGGNQEIITNHNLIIDYQDHSSDIRICRRSTEITAML